MTNSEDDARSILDQATNEYSLRHAANLLNNTFGNGTANFATMNKGDLEVIDFAYQQLHRAANMLEAQRAQRTNGDEG